MYPNYTHYSDGVEQHSFEVVAGNTRCSKETIDADGGNSCYEEDVWYRDTSPLLLSDLHRSDSEDNTVSASSQQPDVALRLQTGDKGLKVFLQRRGLPDIKLY